MNDRQHRAVQESVIVQMVIRSLVVALCRREALSPEARSDLSRLDDPQFRAGLLELARTLRVLGLVVMRLDRESAILAFSQSTTRELRTLAGDLRRAAAGYELERDRVLARLRRAGVDALALKGAALRSTLYMEPAERQTADIDLLVRQEDWESALRSLLQSGYLAPSADVVTAYQRHHFHLRLQHLLGYVVELHWALTKPEQPFRLDGRAFLEHSRMLPRASRFPLRAPRDEHMLLHLVLQSVSESFLTFSRVVDVDRIVMRGAPVDWDFLAAEARRAGLATALALTLELAQRLLGTDIPPTVSDRLQPPRGVRVHVDLLDPAARMLAPIDPRSSAADRLMDFWLLPTDRDRATALARLLAEGSTQRVARRLGEPAEPVADRLLSLVKLFAYQAGLYLSAARKPARRDRSPGRLWMYDRPGDGTGLTGPVMATQPRGDVVP